MAKTSQNKNTKQKVQKPALISVVFAAIAIASYWFWAFPYRAALGYREQLQLFQTTGAYFTEHLRYPAGMATYIGEFLTQFFNNYWIGSAVMTAMLMLFLFLCFCLARKFAPRAPKITTLLISLLPMLALWLCLGNPNVTLSFVVALLCPMALAWGFNAKSRTIYRYIWMIAGTSFLYWFSGATVILFILIALGLAWKEDNTSLVSNAVFSIISILWLAANILAWIPLLPYPITYQLVGIGYTMNPNTLDIWQLIVVVLCVLTPISLTIIARAPQKYVIPATALAVVAVGVILYPKAYDKLTYRLIDYDYMVRANDWEGILQYSDKHNPDLPLSVSATNLALGMTGQLDGRAFDYYQHTAEGLFPPFVKETLSSWMGGEVAFQLGMINTAQRFYFEGMEAIPNYNKSVRAVKRLAETAMIRGDYALARKYLGLLENTMFYRKWAQRNLDLIKDPKGVDQHPLYGQMRSRMIDEEYMFSEGELDKTFGQLYIKNPGNELAKQYLVVYPLLQRDLNKFVQYMGVVAEQQPNYNPLLAQQAMAFLSMKNGQPIPRQIVPAAIEQSLREFAAAWTSKDPARIGPYRRTLYHYLISNE